MRKINITLELHEDEVLQFENWLRDNVKVNDFRVIPDTKELYNNDHVFRILCKKVKQARDVRDKYINQKK